MAKLGDDLEQCVDESMPFVFEKLGDLSALIDHGCLTLAQCALLMPAVLTAKKTGDASNMAAHYVQLALLDIAQGELSPKHPETLLPYSEYLRMNAAGMFGIDGANMPIPYAGWLVSLNEAERWLKGKDFSVNLNGLKAELAEMTAHAAKGEAVPDTSPSGDDWEGQARAIADELFNIDTKGGCRDSLKGYSKRVMELMQVRDIKGARGIIDNSATIMREALQSKKWWANKTK